MSDSSLYDGREQTLVKHFILQKYLERFAHIIGSRYDVLTYVDCFSGPWNARSEHFEDSSFAIALKELRAARNTHEEKGRKLHLRCFFLEKDKAAHAKLKEFSESVKDVMIETRNATLEDSIQEIVTFVQKGGGNSFPFIFIDPKGWTGFAMETIAPLLRLTPGEVLINFMTSHIRRFLDSPQAETQESFRKLFGSGAFRAKVQGLAQQEREDTAVEEYARNVQKTGGFEYACNAIVLHPEIDRTHFNLIYLTRHRKGVEVFKEVERQAMRVQEAARAEARQRRREAQTHQIELFGSQALHNSSHYDSLRDRYLKKAQTLVRGKLDDTGRLLYDDALLLVWSEPMAWESDLKEWIEEWKTDGLLEIEGMQPKQRVPHRNEANYLIWNS